MYLDLYNLFATQLKPQREAMIETANTTALPSSSIALHFTFYSSLRHISMENAPILRVWGYPVAIVAI